MNKDWHAKNKMPKSATMEKRIRWHEEHVRVCGCRPIPSMVQAAMEKSGAGSPRPKQRT